MWSGRPARELQKVISKASGALLWAYKKRQGPSESQPRLSWTSLELAVVATTKTQ